jgi:type I restriction enzyme S subunit
MTFKESKLVELCEIVSSKRVFAASYQSEGVPFFRGKEISQLARGEKTTAELYISEDVYTDVISRTGPIYPGDILLTAVGTLGNPYQVKNADLPFYFKDGNIVWLRKFSNKINSTYLFYWLNSEFGRRKVLDTAIGSTQAALTITGLETISISWPSLAQQTGIVKVLSAIDEKIALNDSLSKSLEDIAQTIFKSWFIDFDPVRTKMEGEKPAGMDSETAALFPDSMEESELGLIPSGWQLKFLGDLITPKKGKTITRATCVDGDVPVVAGGLQPAYYHNTANVLQPAITISASGANAGYVRLYLENIWASDCSYINSEVTNTVHFWYLFLSRNQELIYGMQQGAAQPHIYPSDLMRLKITFPNSFDSLLKFEETVMPLFLDIGALKRQNDSLMHLRDSLLPRLISGELQIPEEMLAS